MLKPQEHGDKRWQRSFVEAGNKLLTRIPYEEWYVDIIPFGVIAATLHEDLR